MDMENNQTLQNKKLSNSKKMSWGRVILLAVVCGIIPGLIMSCPFLEGTSFENIGVCMEAWIALALLVILNCEKPLEAGLKVFVFFLISQPLIYLVQVPFSWMHWQIFMYYKCWFIITLLTLPGGMVAWFTKRGDWLSALILAVADFILMFMEFPMHLTTLLLHFPHQVIALAFVLGSSVFYTLHLLKKKNLRVLSFALKAVFLAAGLFYYMR